MTQSNASPAHIANTYGRIPLSFSSGRGTILTGTDGKRYLDFITGLAVNSLGHGHPVVVEAIKRQAEKPLHLSNLYRIEEQEQLANLLCSGTGFDQVFFCNSGTEANEAAIKAVRKYFFDKGENRSGIITMKNSFHGRSSGGIAATGQEKYQKGFAPLLPGFSYAELNDLESVKALITPETAAVMVEPIQGEGGVNDCDQEFLSGLRELCDQQGILLVFDEVQVGMGRTGKLFCHEHYGVSPDLMSLAKALAGGLPIGALLGKQEVMSALTPGSHASTFGGNPFVCGVAVEVVKFLSEPGFLTEVRAKSDDLRFKLATMRERYPFIKKIKGKGMIIGIDLDIDAAAVATKAMERGLLLNAIGGKVLRLLPPLTVSTAEIDEALAILDEIFSASSV